MNDNKMIIDHQPFQLAWSLYHHRYWCKQDLLEWIYLQLADEPDNLFWTNLIMYEPDVYFCLYTEQFPPAFELDFQQTFAFFLTHTNLSDTESIANFNTWLLRYFYTYDKEDANSPECEYFYQLDYMMDCDDEKCLNDWVVPALKALLPEAQQNVQQVLAILKQS